VRHRSRDLRGRLWCGARRGRATAARPRVPGRGRAGRSRVRARRPRRGDRAAVVRPLQRLRAGVAGRLPHGRLRRARYHAAGRLRQRPGRRGRREPRGDAALAGAPCRAGRAGLDLRPGDPACAGGRRAPAVASRARARHRAGRDRHAVGLLPAARRVRGVGCRALAGNDREGEAGGGLRRQLRLDRHFAARRAGRGDRRLRCRDRGGRRRPGHARDDRAAAPGRCRLPARR
jgi:hypothetical protein